MLILAKSFGSFIFLSYICTPNEDISHSQISNGPMDEWLSHRSAKPSTAVRIRFGPHRNSVRNHSNAVFLLFCTA